MRSPASYNVLAWSIPGYCSLLLRFAIDQPASECVRQDGERTLCLFPTLGPSVSLDVNCAATAQTSRAASRPTSLPAEPLPMVPEVPYQRIHCSVRRVGVRAKARIHAGAERVLSIGTVTSTTSHRSPSGSVGCVLISRIARYVADSARRIHDGNKPKTVLRNSESRRIGRRLCNKRDRPVVRAATPAGCG